MVINSQTCDPDMSAHHDHLQTVNKAKFTLVPTSAPPVTYACKLSSQITVVFGSISIHFSKYKCHSKNSLVNVALYHIHHIWHYKVRLRESGQPIGRLRKLCKNAFPRAIPVSFGRLDTSIATESS
ncbi:hypothetical protein TNCV_812711 [Trichonephila clavipes]|nr:hypothetical protein TNCV_812711 [Trichonephila clavipes]